MPPVPTDLGGKSDAELIESVRSGKIAAYGTLYERHSAAAHNLARQLARSGAEADDLVSEAFAKLLDTLRAGNGPDTAFRAYLLTALRHTAYDRTRKAKRIDLTEDMTDAGGAVGEALTVPFSDTAVAGLERTLAAKAFAKLPERWQAVLWHTEIEQQSPAEVAPLLGLTANGVSALAYRAREGLRQAYLQVHLAETSGQRCRATAERLGAWTRDGLSKRECAQVETHLDECDRCQALAAELADVNGGLRLIIAPMILGGAVSGYLAAAGATKASAATAGALFATAGATGSSGAGGAAAGPRQFAGVAASAVAVAASVAVALAAGGGSQEIPAVSQAPARQAPAAQAPAQPTPPSPAAPPAEPPAPVVAPAPPPPPPAAPMPPAPPTAPPAPPTAPPAPPTAPPAPLSAPVVPSAPPSPDAPAPPQTPVPVSPAAPPSAAPTPPTMAAQAPPQGVELQPGTATNLPITVRNDGGSVSEPVVVALKLPPGVTAVPTGGGGGAAQSRLGPFSAQSAQDTISVNCPGGTDTVTCRTEKGLEPGQSAVLTFRLVADETAQPSTVAGSVTAGALITVSVSVKVTVKPPPDAVELRVASAWDSAFPWIRHPVVRMDVRNAGSTTKSVDLMLDRPGQLILGNRLVACHPRTEGTDCSTRGALKPGERLSLWFVLEHRPQADDGVTVTATLGLAMVSKTLYFDCWGPICDGPQDPQTPPGPAEPPSRPSLPGRPTPTETPAATTPPTPENVPGETRQPNVTTSEPPLPSSPEPEQAPSPGTTTPPE